MTNEATFHNDAAVRMSLAEYDRTGNMLDLELRLGDAGERLFGTFAGHKLVSAFLDDLAAAEYDAADRATRRAESGYCE